MCRTITANDKEDRDKTWIGPLHQWTIHMTANNKNNAHTFRYVNKAKSGILGFI